MKGILTVREQRSRSSISTESGDEGGNRNVRLARRWAAKESDSFAGEASEESNLLLIANYRLGDNEASVAALLRLLIKGRNFFQKGAEIGVGFEDMAEEPTLGDENTTEGGLCRPQASLISRGNIKALTTPCAKGRAYCSLVLVGASRRRSLIASAAVWRGREVRLCSEHTRVCCPKMVVIQ